MELILNLAHERNDFGDSVLNHNSKSMTIDPKKFPI